MSERGGCERYGPEEIFSLVEGELSPAEERAVRRHLAECPCCRARHEREQGISSSLRLGFAAPQPRGPREPGSVACNVAMALPTRSLRARLCWALAGGAALAVILLALEVWSSSPVSAVADVLGLSWGIAAGLADVLSIFFTTTGWFLIFAMLVGALIDIGIAIGILLFRRRRAGKM